MRGEPFQGLKELRLALFPGLSLRSNHWAEISERLRRKFELLVRLSKEADQRFVAGDAAEGEGDLVVAFEGDGVGEFDGDLREVKVRDFADVFDDEGIDAMFAVFELDLDG